MVGGMRAPPLPPRSNTSTHTGMFCSKCPSEAPCHSQGICVWFEWCRGPLNMQHQPASW
jgi:hypothetical protein